VSFSSSLQFIAFNSQRIQHFQTNKNRMHAQCLRNKNIANYFSYVHFQNITQVSSVSSLLVVFIKQNYNNKKKKEMS
jgi:hypothetical protein